MKYTRLFLFAMLCCCSFSFCASVNDGQSTIKQGVFGRVMWQQGNFMPSPDRPQQKGSTPAIRTIYIYQRTKMSDAEGESPLFSKINTKLVAKVKSNKEGYYQCKLAPGSYSIFTLEEDGKFFANLFDGDGSITPFEVKENERTTVNININYKAVY